MVEQSQDLPAPAATPSTVWRKSTASSGGNDSCLEIAMTPDVVLVRDSKDATGPRLRFGSSAWTGFIDTIQ